MHKQLPNLLMLDSAEQPTLNHALIVKDRNGPKAYWLTAEVYTLGRDASNSIRIDSRFVSRRHAMLYRVATPDGQLAYQILDGDADGNLSTNGIFINDCRVEFVDLNHGDEIRLSSDATATYITTAKTFDYILSTYEHTKIVD